MESINPDIRSAWTIPSRVYTDPELFQRSKDLIFARSWQLVGDDQACRSPGQVQPLRLLEGVLDEPVLLARGADDALRCLSNVCTHRGAEVVDRPGRLDCLKCPYHGRRFELDGTFRSMPEFATAANFPSERDNLPNVPVGTWGPFVLVSLDPAVGLEDVIGPMRERLSWLPIQQARLEPSLAREYLVRANWALYCENYMEGFHVPFVHESLGAAIDYSSYSTECFEHSILQMALAKGGSDAFEPPASSPDHGKQVAGYYWWLFPNTMFNVYPWGISVNIVRPLDVGVTKVSFLPYVWDASKLDSGAGSDLDRVEREDEVVVESVQRGVRSRLYDRGRYSPTREQGVHHFHRMLAAWLQLDTSVTARSGPA